MNDNFDIKNFDSIMTNKIPFQNFVKFLIKDMNAEQIFFLYDINLLKSDNQDIEKRISFIMEKYFKDDSPLYIRGFFGIEKRVQENPNKNIFDTVQNSIERDIKMKHFPRFLSSKEFTQTKEEILEYYKKSELLFFDLIKRFERKERKIIKENDQSVPINIDNYSIIELFTNEYIQEVKKINKYYNF